MHCRPVRVGADQPANALNDSAMMDKRLIHWGMYAALFLALCALIFLRFREFFPSVFYGDDLAMFMYAHGTQSHNPQVNALLAYIGTSKFRPVFTGLLTLETWLFAKHLGRYLIVNVIINAATGAAAFAVFLQLSRSRLIAAVLAATLVTSRFALYQVTQVTGQVESIPFLMFALMLLFVHRAVTTEDAAAARRYEWISLALWMVAFNAHERYIAVFPWLIFCFLVYRRPVGIKHRTAFLGVMGLAILANAAIKMFVQKSSFFVGTGGQNLSISPNSILELLRQALRSIVGINTGPDYLIGYSWENLPDNIQWVAIGFAVLAVCMAVIALARAFWNDGLLRSFPLLLALLAAAMIVPAAMTIRMEQRWELAPFFLLLCLVAAASSANKNRLVPAVAVVALCSAHIWVDLAANPGFKLMAIMYEERYARTVKDSVIPETKPGQSVYLVGDESHCSWALLRGTGFFTFYEGSDRKATCISSALDARNGEAPIFAPASPAKLVNVTAQVRAAPMRGIDLMSMKNDSINDKHEDTPSGSGTFTSSTDWMLGAQRTLTILSTHGVKFPSVNISAGATLEIEGGMIFSTSDPSEIVVTIKPVDGSSGRQMRFKVPLLESGDARNVTRFEMPLSALSSPADISIGIETPSGNLSAQWVGLTSIRIVKK